MKKNTIILTILIAVTALLGGCSGVENQTGLFYNTFVAPFAFLIHEIGHFFGDNFGLAIIFITLLIRLVLMPFMLKTYKHQQEMKEKMAKIKPEMEEIKKRSKEANTPEAQKQAQQEIMELYQKHNVNPFNMGCLPMLIQMPILTGLYFAIRSSQEIATHSFLWFNLGHTDVVMTIIAGLVYFVQAQVSMVTMPEDQKKQMRIFMYISPVMIMFISFSAPAALPLYWAVGGIFLIIQTWIGRKYYQQKPVESNE
ncbi:membrane protein insertase YidC [Bacillus sp. FJAT-50079]|uniref:membrane protein insertase YidC n=1 Tax=Bacillus sp. FJAT-50079 TaxID=2833577 RepID=UPI001BC9B3FA|nr:membrane protein insertase YidC [Bacillus sp. FJAT-50079]MBS4207972.1 membrane protein insertase YidC [Bacillus sp. FJAT-50079]